MQRYPGLDEFVAARGPDLVRLCVLLAGSRPGGEDLLQQGLERLLRHWRRIDGDPEGYLRRTLYRLAVDGWRLSSRRRELLRGELPEVAGPDAAAAVDTRDALGRALLALPPRQRAVIVLRHWEQLSEQETAAVLGISVGAVKSSTSRGLARLRQIAELEGIVR